MGLLDDAIREHLELKRRHGAAEEEVARLEKEALSGAAAAAAAAAAAEAAAPPPAAAEPEPALPVQPAAEVPAPAEPTAPATAREDPEPWLDEPDEVPFEDALDHRRAPQPTSEFSAEEVAEAHGEPAADYVAPDDEPAEDLLEETPDFLQETPEHERLWFEQKPPRDFDFGS